MRKSLISYFARSPFSLLCVMTISFLGFGYFSINLFLIFKSNIELINRHGLMAMKDGAALQLLMLLLTAFVSVVFYSLWKVVERLFVDWVLRADD